MFAVQAAPVIVQDPEHFPLLQTFEQQSLVVVHVAPSFPQIGPHMPFSHALPVQQPLPQGSPSGVHEVQTWLAHVPLQQSENAAQASPPGLQADPDDPEDDVDEDDEPPSPPAPPAADAPDPAVEEEPVDVHALAQAQKTVIAAKDARTKIRMNVLPRELVCQVEKF